MNMHIFMMEIIEEIAGKYRIRISNSESFTELFFNPITKQIEFLRKNNLTRFLQENEYQLRKMLHNKKHNTFYKGFRLKFVLRDKKDVAEFNDRSKIVVLDNRQNQYQSYVVSEGQKNIYKIYTDGSFQEKSRQGAFALIIKDLKDAYYFHTEKVECQNSNLIELLAAMRGLERLSKIEKIRIITDSQYVRKGLTEWIVNWKLNDWYTVNGEKVKHIDYWKRFEQLSQHKYIEFQWVKGHSNHFENTLCDLYAKETAKR